MKLYGLGFTDVLTLIFVTLKLTGVIGWSWWWVLSPTLIGLGFALTILLIATVAHVRTPKISPWSRK